MTPLLALQSHYLTGRLRLKSSSKCLLIDLDTPLSPREDSSLLLFSLSVGTKEPGAIFEQFPVSVCLFVCCTIWQVLTIGRVSAAGVNDFSSLNETIIIKE